MFVVCRCLIPSSSRIFLLRNILLPYLGTLVFYTFLINMHGWGVGILYWIVGWPDKRGVLYLYICFLSFFVRQCSTSPSSDMTFHLQFILFLLCIILLHNLISFQVQDGILRLPNPFHKISVIIIHFELPSLPCLFLISPASLGCFE